MTAMAPILRPARAAALLACLLGLAACGPLLSATTADVAGIASAGVAGALTRDPAIATGIGLGVAAGANAGLQYAERRTHEVEQTRIAEAAGPLEPGTVGQWSVAVRPPIEGAAHGEVAVTRALGGASLDCKEIVFSVDTQDHGTPRRAFYTANVCRDGEAWKWASAEPATERWGALQ
jgi:hypothetical protein